MGYLRLYDYIANIQTPQLNQLLQGIDDKRILKEAASQAQITSYLIQKFDCAMEFQNTTVFNLATTYQANQLVEYNYPAWSSAVNYSVDTFVSYTDGNCYICINTTTNQPPTDTGYWTKIGKQNDLYFVAYPKPLFQETKQYFVGDQVYWNGSVYTCIIPTQTQSHISQLQSGTYANIPLENVFPDNRQNGAAYWGVGVPYSVTGVRPDTDTTIWTFGDNRNAQIVECMIWITIYKLSPLISPRNIPPLWENKYKEYLTWLQMCAEGDVTLTAPEIQPAQGARIRWGGAIKQSNGY